MLWNALFAKSSIIALDGVNTSIPGGWLDHNWKQLYIQFAYVCAVCAYTFIMTALLAKAVDLIPGMHLRATDEAEHMGMDDDQLGEFANDYIEVRRDFDDWTPPAGVEKSWLRLRAGVTDSEPSVQGHVAAGDRHGFTELGQHERQTIGKPDLEPIAEKI